jgi:hypothetical protein
MKSAPTICLILGLLAVFPVAGAAPRALPLKLELPDVNGRKTMLFEGASNRLALVFVMLANECPIANRAIPELARLHNSYTNRGVAFFFVHANADETDSAVREHAREFALPATPFRDPGLKFTRAAGLKVTPTALVAGPDGRILYRGRINDQFTALGQGRPAPARHDLQLALDAVLAGRPVETPETPVVGCHIVERP